MFDSLRDAVDAVPYEPEKRKDSIYTFSPATNTVKKRFFTRLIAYIFVRQTMCVFVGDDVHGVPLCYE